MTSFIDFHIVQSLPPNNINRDDTGAPKDAIYGGHRRARVSSQCSKRAIRKFFASANLFRPDELAIRTRQFMRLIADGIDGDREQVMTAAANALGAIGIKVAEAKKAKGKKAEDDAEPVGDATTGYMLFLSRQTVEQLTALVRDNLDALVTNKPSKELTKDLVAAMANNTSPDIALFGRMLADATHLSVDAAVSVAHAISSNRIDREADFFTAVDDLAGKSEADAAHLGSTEFNSSCLYRFSTINYDQLAANLQGDRELALRTVRAYARAVVLAMPTGHQTTFAAHTPPGAVLIGVHNTQPLSLASAFEKPVWHGEHDNGLSAATVARLQKRAAELTAAYGLELGLQVMDTTGGWDGDAVSTLDQLIDNTIAALG